MWSRYQPWCHSAHVMLAARFAAKLACFAALSWASARYTAATSSRAESPRQATGVGR